MCFLCLDKNNSHIESNLKKTDNRPFATYHTVSAALGLLSMLSVCYSLNRLPYRCFRLDEDNENALNITMYLSIPLVYYAAFKSISLIKRHPAFRWEETITQFIDHKKILNKD